MLLRQTTLSANVVQFCRYLRGYGFTMGVHEQSLAMRALEHIDYASREEFGSALQAVLCRSQQQVVDFEKHFAAYWKELEKAVNSKEKKAQSPEAKPKTTPAESFKAIKTWLHGNQNKEEENMASYSAIESLVYKDFSNIPKDELAELMQYIRALARRLAAKANRRFQPAKDGNRPDLRKTLRTNMRRGGELIQLEWKERKPNRNKLVILCDVSQSMELYSSFLLQFIYAFQQAFNRTKTFAFGTQLMDITDNLKSASFSIAMKALSKSHPGWKGGTKIGECLSDFVRQYGDRCIDKKTIVIILSDGWDQGNPEKISFSMAWMKTKAKKVIWLNPLMGNPAYRPETAGMQAAIPHIHVLAAANNAQSLRKLARII